MGWCIFMKITFKDKFRYWFDNLMSKGTVSLVGILFLATAIVVVVVGTILALVQTDDGSLLSYVWASVMHIIDAGTITAADTSDVSFVILMSIVTLCGIFVTSILIGIITTGFEEKLTSLKKGNSRVIEQNHVVILGFDNNVYTLISELITANENQKRGCIVILANEDKETMEQAISDEIEDFKTTKVICRTGSITDKNMLSRCSLESARSIIVNETQDFMTIKTIIAINNYFSSIGKSENLPHIVATINKAENYDTINIISNGNAELVLIEDSISRIIAQSCRQPGLSTVLVELFDYDGDELYFESYPELEGISFGDALNRFEKAIVFGFMRDGKIHLNPEKDIPLKKDDSLILLVEDDGVAKTKEYRIPNVDKLSSSSTFEDAPENIMIIGMNDMFKSIVIELDNYFAKDSNVFVAHSEIDESIEELSISLKNIKLTAMECNTENRKTLEDLTAKNLNHVLLLSDYEKEEETSDSMTLFKLIHLRDIAQKEGYNFSITSEMRDVSNQKLAEVAQVNDLVVGSNIINLILTQISENRNLSTVFQELLQSDGSEIYIRKAHNYVKLDTEMDFHDVTEILRKQDSIAIGYKKQTKDNFDIIINPSKSDKVTFTKDDYIISLSAD